MLGTFTLPPRVNDPDMHHGKCVTHVPWCMPGWLTSGSLWSWWRGKRPRYSRRMRNPQFYVSGKRPVDHVFPREEPTTYLAYTWASLPSRTVCPHTRHRLVQKSIARFPHVPGCSGSTIYRTTSWPLGCCLELRSNAPRPNPRIACMWWVYNVCAPLHLYRHVSPRRIKCSNINWITSPNQSSCNKVI